MPVRFVLNGVPYEVEPAPADSALDMLRTHCGIRSTKDGCQPQGQCGCCLVLVNGQPRTTCATPATKLDGKEIVTLEGVDAVERDRIADCFTRAVGHQCGFCIPGIALKAHALLEKSPSPT
ncbi:2Fe-2S iron-sulfur cluster binding domain-containing protein, partial [bacterium]|nr:2Fe-2S iron-sulfur cluster binding domain-containing protein [bacterium]